LYCEKCEHNWPPQNYMSTTGQPNGMLWLDGFLDSHGVTRQYIFTEEECRGVASQIIGNERVFAIGIAFFLSKQPKPVVPNYGLGSWGFVGPAVLPKKHFPNHE